MMKPYKPEISASAVAGLIGMNPYRAPHEVMYQVLQKNAAAKETIRRLENVHRRIPKDLMIRRIAADTDVRKIVSDGLEETRTNPDIRGVVDSAAAKIGIVGALRYSSIPAEERDGIVKEVASAIQKQRGLRNENQILDNYEKDTKTKVTERNTRMVRKDYGPFVLIGRIDGFVESLKRVVDSKERTYFRSEPPMYDEIQMRVYMDLTSAKDAELVERFPNQEVRKTVYTNDADKWTAIHMAIRTASQEIMDAISDEAKLLRIIESNTFTMSAPMNPNEGAIGINYIV